MHLNFNVLYRTKQTLTQTIHPYNDDKFIDDIFMTEGFDSGQGSEFDNICKDLRCYKYFDSHKLIEITEDEYEMCIDEFGENLL